MGTRAIRLALIIVLGAGMGLLITRPWRGGEPVEATALPVSAEPVMTPSASKPPRSEPATASRADTAGEVPPPPTRTFKLPAMAAAAPAVQVKPKEEPAKRPNAPTILVPKDWLLRGTGPQSYDVKSDRAEVFTGQASVQLASHDKNVANTEFASLMQTVVGEPWVGKRVEFSASIKTKGMYQMFDVWIRAVDAANVVIAFDRVQSAYRKPEWKKTAAVIDVPWSAAEIAYGVNLEGSGALHVDDARLKVIDKSMPAPLRNMPAELGVVVQVADKKGPLAMPSNLDFEDVIPADDSFREVPTDALGRTRF